MRFTLERTFIFLHSAYIERRISPGFGVLPAGKTFHRQALLSAHLPAPEIEIAGA
jgi:hypothetical protein